MTKEVGGRKQPAKTVLALLVVSSAFLTNLIAQGIDTTAYFPLSVGDTYTYYQSPPCPPDTVRQRIGPWAVSRIVDTAIVDGKKYFLGEGSSDMVRVDSACNVIVRRSGIEQVRYKLAAAVGDTWSYSETAGGREYIFKVTMQSRTDTVRVHAGTFTRCLRIYFDVPGGIDDEYTVWLAPDVGEVFLCVFEPEELYEATINGIYYPMTASVQGEPNPIVSFELYQNYPNPFNPETVIRFDLKTHGSVKLRILDILGREVIELVNDIRQPWSYEVPWNGKDRAGRSVASGIYFCHLTFDQYQMWRKILLAR